MIERKALQCKLAVGDVTYIPRWERRCRVCNSCIWPWLLMYSMLHCYHPVSTHSSALATSYFTLQCTGYIITSHHSTGYIIKSDHSTGYIILQWITFFHCIAFTFTVSLSLYHFHCITLYCPTKQTWCIAVNNFVLTPFTALQCFTLYHPPNKMVHWSESACIAPQASPPFTEVFHPVSPHTSSPLHWFSVILFNTER